MRYPPMVYSLALEMGIDADAIARWPARKVYAWLAYFDWDRLQRDRQEGGGGTESDPGILAKRKQAKQALNKNAQRRSLGGG